MGEGKKFLSIRGGISGHGDAGTRRHWKKFDKYGNLLITISYHNNREVRINGVKVELPDDNIKLIK